MNSHTTQNHFTQSIRQENEEEKTRLWALQINVSHKVSDNEDNDMKVQ